MWIWNYTFTAVICLLFRTIFTPFAVLSTFNDLLTLILLFRVCECSMVAFHSRLHMLVMQTWISASHYSGRSLFHHQITMDINTLWLVSNAISFQKFFDAGTWTLAGKGNCSQMSLAPRLHVHHAGNQKLDAGLDAIFRFCQENDSRFELFNNVALPFWLCAPASPWWLCQSGEIWRPQSQRNSCGEKSTSLKYHVLLLWKVRVIRTHL